MTLAMTLFLEGRSRPDQQPQVLQKLVVLTKCTSLQIRQVSPKCEKVMQALQEWRVIDVPIHMNL